MIERPDSRKMQIAPVIFSGAFILLLFWVVMGFVIAINHFHRRDPIGMTTPSCAFDGLFIGASAAAVRAQCGLPARIRYYADDHTYQWAYGSDSYAYFGDSGTAWALQAPDPPKLKTGGVDLYPQKAAACYPDPKLWPPALCPAAEVPRYKLNQAELDSMWDASKIVAKVTAASSSSIIGTHAPTVQSVVFRFSSPAGAYLTVHQDGSMTCTKRLTPSEYRAAVSYAGIYGGLLKALWPTANCDKKVLP